MKVHYLEIVTPDVDGVCKAYEHAHDVEFGVPDELLGGSRTCSLADGSIVGVRGQHLLIHQSQRSPERQDSCAGRRGWLIGGLLNQHGLLQLEKRVVHHGLNIQ